MKRTDMSSTGPTSWLPKLSTKFSSNQPSAPCTPKSVSGAGLRRQEEGLANYKPGGYHPVEIGDVLNHRFCVVRKLGWGHFSTVWLAEDATHNNHQRVAVKVQKSGKAYSEAAVDEIKLLREVEQRHPVFVVKMMDSFKIRGPNGEHHCMVFELLGDNLLALTRFYSRMPGKLHLRYGKGVPLPIVKRVMKDVLAGLDFMHSKCQIIHTDLKPENILLMGPLSDMFSKPEGGNNNADHLQSWGVDPQAWNTDTFAKIVDLGNSCWTYKHFTDYITTRQYRSPEAIVEYSYGAPVDIWSAACVCFELITGEYLFDPRADKNEVYSRDEDHLALMLELLGEPPACLTSQGKASATYFTREGKLRKITDLLQWPLGTLLRDKFAMPDMLATELASFLTPMLDLDPSTRASARTALSHPWLQLHSTQPTSNAQPQ